MTSSSYAMEGGEVGKARLDVLSRMMEPVTTPLLDRVGVPIGGTCLDVGCGGGHVGAAIVQLLLDDDCRHIHGLTLDRIAPALVDSGLAGSDEVAALSAELHALADDPETLVATPRFFQAWGIVPAHSA